MIDLKTVKEIRISEGSVTKITDSSGVVLWEVKSTSEQTPCYYVAENVSDLPSTPKYDMAYITSVKSWYALNNKSQWEKYGVIEAVSSLDNVTTYNGKLVYNTTDKHQYKYTNNAWTDQGEVSESVVKNYWAECKQNDIELYHITYHWGEGYHIEFESAYNSTSSTNYKQFVDCKFDNDTHGPIEIGEGTDSYYYDQHYPTSTTSNACDTSDYSKRTWIYSAHNANTRYRLKVWNDKIEQHKYDDDSLVTSSTVSWSAHSWYNGLYEMGLYTANSNLIWHAARFYDSDNNLTDEWLVQSDGSIKETLTQTVVQPQSVATGVTVSEYGNMTTYTYPTNYEQYDAPNLNYTECANEAAMKALSCPYEGMKVKLTDTGKKYKFTYNSTTSQYEWDEITSRLDVDLNNQWVESTKTLDGYKVYMSNSNHNVNNGYASMKFKFEGMPDFKLWINSYAESSFDYTVAWNLDVDYPTSNPSSSTSGVKANTSGKQHNPTNITAFTEVDYANDGGEHFVVVTYRKDSRINANSNDDRGYVAVKLMLISTTWVVSATEFVKKDDKYYQRLNEVGTYEGGVTALTGNYKEGNELTVTYKQGSADDYMIVGSGKYYKNYIYVTPKDQEINTGDYIQGDYIGEATPSMKVTYTDYTEKTFYNLTSIESNTDANKSNAKEVVIYDGVTKIGNSAFKGCSSLTGITIPSGVTIIGRWAFQSCSSLTSITIPSGVTSIGEWAFQFCSNLTSITIPSGVTSIGYGTFEYCSALTGITIPSGVTEIGEYAFDQCTNLASVTIENSTSTIDCGYRAFSYISSSAKLYVPSNLWSDYQNDSSWTDAFKGGIYAIPS